MKIDEKCYPNPHNQRVILGNQAPAAWAWWGPWPNGSGMPNYAGVTHPTGY